MTARWEILIPEALHGAVREALTATYGLAAVECLGPVTGGASGAIALRLAAGGRQHLLRVEAWRSPIRNPHQYACLTVAAEAGVAPPLHHVDAESGVAVMDFIDAVALDRFPDGEVARAARSDRSATLINHDHSNSVSPFALTGLRSFSEHWNSSSLP